MEKNLNNENNMEENSLNKLEINDENQNPEVDDDNREVDISHFENKIQELNDKLLRSIAEIDNTRKRYERQIEEIREYSIVNFAKELLVVLDNLNMAINYKPENPSQETKNVLIGVEMTLKEFSNILAKHGINKIEPKKGEKFDYNTHHAISQVENHEFSPGSILDVINIGYKIKERLLRPAIVSVSKAVENDKD